jgi:hypothetical protein
MNFFQQYFRRSCADISRATMNFVVHRVMMGGLVRPILDQVVICKFTFYNEFIIRKFHSGVPAPD